jgi:hypothetical protein
MSSPGVAGVRGVDSDPQPEEKTAKTIRLMLSTQLKRREREMEIMGGDPHIDDFVRL